jgi:hypothetical protein
LKKTAPENDIITILPSLLKCLSWIEKTMEKEDYRISPMNLSALATSYFNISKIASVESYYRKGLNLIWRVLEKQNSDGSWNEIYPGINVKSTLATAYVGLMLYKAGLYDGKLLSAMYNNLLKAAEYVIVNEKRPGYFIKSEVNDHDTVNVNLVCALFLLYMHKYFQRDDFLNISLRTMRRMMKVQLESGAFQYYSDEKQYLTPLHYHAFDTRLLAEYFTIIPNDNIRSVIMKAVAWLSSKIDKNGRLNWSGDLAVWVYRIFSTYGNTFYTFSFVSNNIDYNFKKFAERVARYIISRQHSDGSFPESDFRPTLGDYLVDFKNVLQLLSRKELFPALLPSREIIEGRSFLNTLFYKTTINIQMLESLTSAYCH